MSNQLAQADVRKRVIRAVDNLLAADSYLLIHDLNERTMTHRLAVHLGLEFASEGWDVDCEYNRDGHDDTKKLDLPSPEEVQSDDVDARTVFPDVIVHHRGGRGSTHNLLVIEAKKTTNPRGHDFDLRKLLAFRDPVQLGYRVTVFLLLETKTANVAAVLDFCDGRPPIRRTSKASR